MSIGSLVSGKRFEAVTPHDTNDIEVTRAVFIETTGDVAVLGEHDNVSVTIPGLLGGVWHPMSVKRILASGTDASTVYVSR